MDKKHYQLPPEVLSGFKTAGELESFLQGLFKQGVEQLLEAEMEEHLGYSKHSRVGSGNSRNGKGSKQLKTTLGDIHIQPPRDRKGSFQPLVIGKRKGVMEKIEDIVISLYARGMSTRDIEQQIKDIYGVSLSSSSISNITERVLIDVQEWQTRPLDDQYLIVWMDGVCFKVRQENRIITKSVHLVIGLNTHGRKELLGMWINEKEHAGFWMEVLNDLRQRGLQDILIACTDNLKGLTQAIKAMFPQTITQLCIVHQIRNTLKYIPYKKRTAVMQDLRAVYGAINLQQAEQAMLLLKEKWENHYPASILSWLKNWEELTPYFAFPPEIRKIIYTTNTIESLNRNIRKFTKNRVLFPDDQSVIKAVFLATQQIALKWKTCVANWPLIAQQFEICYPNRAKINTFNSNYQ
jgi:transposase-like protein